MAPLSRPGVRNVHAREIAAEAEVLGDLLDRLGGPRDQLWPSPAWWPMRLTGVDGDGVDGDGVNGDGLAVGARGGHASIRYRVVEYEPGRRVCVRFTSATGFDGYHELTVDPLPPAPSGAPRCRLRHVLWGRPAIWQMRLKWPLVVRPLHDALLEDLLDRAEYLATGRVASPAAWSGWVRLLHAATWPSPRAVPVPGGAKSAGTAARADFADAYRVGLRPGMPQDPGAWATAVLGNTPPWFRLAVALRDASAALVGMERLGRPVLTPRPSTLEEVVLGADATHLDVRVSFVGDGGGMVLSTAASTNDVRGRWYLRAVRAVHPLVVRGLLRRAGRRIAVEAAPPIDRSIRSAG
jgi:hypothetical protein